MADWHLKSLLINIKACLGENLNISPSIEAQQREVVPHYIKVPHYKQREVVPHECCLPCQSVCVHVVRVLGASAAMAPLVIGKGLAVGHFAENLFLQQQMSGYQSWEHSPAEANVRLPSVRSTPSITNE